MFFEPCIVTHLCSKNQQNAHYKQSGPWQDVHPAIDQTAYVDA